MEIKCDIYKSEYKADTYLYLRSDLEAAELPEPLLKLLGQLSQFLSLSLTPSSKLAQADIDDVLLSLKEQGYFLQMPPAETLKKQAPGTGFIQ